LALFGKKKKKQDEEGSVAAPGGNGEASAETKDGQSDDAEAQLEYSPEKARKFFEHAKAMHETTNYEYAMKLWLDGLRWDPSSMSALEGFWQSASSFVASGKGGKRPPSAETKKSIGMYKGAPGRYVQTLLSWGCNPLDPLRALQATEAAAKLGQPEPTYWLGDRALRVARADKKPRKELFVKLMEAFGKVGAYDKAVEAGEDAVRVDPADGKLAAHVRNLSAQATMSRGGYDTTGEEGGFRRNVRDFEKQRELDAGERIVKTEDEIDRLVASAEADHQRRPDDLPALTELCRRLLERGRPEDEKRAYKLYMSAYESSKQFRFKEWAGDIKLRVARRQLANLREAAKQNPDNEAAQQKFAKARENFLRAEVEEFRARVEAYPTDHGKKFELGRRLFELREFDEAIPLLQEAQQSSKHRVQSRLFLGESFLAIGYHDEAIQTFRQAIDGHHDDSDETGLAVRFGLLKALQAKAEEERSLRVAEEADSVASEISIKQFNYRDVRERRDTIKKLISELRKGDAA